MRILVVSIHLPGPNDDHGVYQRLGTFAQALDRVGELEFLFFVGPHKNTDPEEAAALMAARWGIRKPRVYLERYGEDPGSSRLYADYLLPITSIHRQQRFARLSGPAQVAAFERHLARSPDLIFAHRLGVMCPILLSNRPTPPILFDLDDIEHVARARSIPKPPAWRLKRLEYLQLPALWQGERAAIKRADVTFVCSEEDRDYLRRTMRVDKVGVLPNSVATPADIPPASSAPPGILFLGAYGYPPNALAAEILVRDIWPRVRAQVPDARLIIAGARPELIPSFGKHPDGVDFTGFVDDLGELYARTRVVCTPIQNGGGTRIKIIEAAMHGRPVVSTRIGAEGLALAPGQEILICDTTESLARACVALLEDPARCDALGTAAHQAAAAHYGREAAIENIAEAARQALARAGQGIENA